MAKYTELLSEYIESGGTLPAIFEQIEGFSDLFKAKYFDYEIGFETEALFTMKLELKANLVIPIYKTKIAQIEQAYLNMLEPNKTFNETKNTTINAGKQRGTTTELPFNSENATPNSINETDPYTNTDETELNRTEGASVDEKIKIFDKLIEPVKPIYDQLLNEFKGLFMAIY